MRPGSVRPVARSLEAGSSYITPTKKDWEMGGGYDGKGGGSTVCHASVRGMLKVSEISWSRGMLWTIGAVETLGIQASSQHHK